MLVLREKLSKVLVFRKEKLQNTVLFLLIFQATAESEFKKIFCGEGAKTRRVSEKRLPRKRADC